MAKHYRRKSHRRGYGAFLPKLSDLKGSVKGTDVLIGVGIGIAGLLGLRYYINTAKDLPTFLKPAAVGETNFFRANLGALGPVLAGLVGYAAAKKWKPGMANSILVGSLGSGLALFGLQKLEGYEMTVEGVKKTPFQPLAGWGGFGILAPDAPFGILAEDAYGRREQELEQMAAFAAQNDLDEVLS